MFLVLGLVSPFRLMFRGRCILSTSSHTLWMWAGYVRNSSEVEFGLITHWKNMKNACSFDDVDHQNFQTYSERKVIKGSLVVDGGSDYV